MAAAAAAAMAADAVQMAIRAAHDEDVARAAAHAPPEAVPLVEEDEDEPTLHAELSLADMAARWKRDLFTNVIAFWEKHSLDREHGGYFTCLDRDGAILDDSKYMWLQCRAVFMWSRLFNEFGAKKYFDAAQLGADFLKHGKDAEGRLYFAVSRDGATPLHFQRKPYRCSTRR